MLPEPGQPFNVGLFIREQSNITLASALQTPQVSRLNKENPGDLAAAISQLLQFVNKLFNLPENKKLNDAQMAVLALDIKKRYWFLKFDELVYILREGVAGKWGKSYSRIDAETVHAWFQRYIETERDAAIELASYNEAVAYKKQEAAAVITNPMPDHIRQGFAELRQKPEREAIPEIKPEPNAPELTQESALKQFSELLPTLSLPDVERLLKDAQMKQNREMVQLIEVELSNRSKAA